MIQIGLSFVQAWRPQLKMESQAAFDAGDSAVADLELQELLERECEMQVKRLQEESTRMQNRLRETAGEAREILLAAPTKHNEAKLETFLRESLGASK